ncbi:MAG: MFS transporter [Anaerolineae bacterium]|nr:MFS transporter [Anaerolineae bacterium]
MAVSSRYKIFIVGVFFFFILLHQADKLVIGQVLSDIQADFDLNDAQSGSFGTGALLVAAICYPLWGWLYDRFARPKLVALASFIWGITTMFGAVAQTFGLFFLARSSSGIDDSSYPGIYSLMADYFPPKTRGKIYGILQAAAPLGAATALLLVFILNDRIGWRNIFLITGGLGILVGLLIFFGIRERQRGQSEPELENLQQIAQHRFDWAVLGSLLRRRSLIPLYLQGFFGVFPFTVLNFWFFTYLERERGYDSGQVFALMGAAIAALGVGALVGGGVGDRLFGRFRRGRLTVSMIGVTLSLILLTLTLSLPLTIDPLFYGISLMITAFFMLFSGPNVISTMYDITAPEIRSTALSVQYFIESIGSALAPLLVGVLSDQIGLTGAIGLVCLITYASCALFLVLAVWFVPQDIERLREQMRERADESAVLTGAAG